MSTPCPALPQTRRRVAARLDDTLSAAESRALKEHVAACRSCAAEALHLDPTLLFAPLAREPGRRGDESEARRMAADVLAAVEIERTRRRVGAVPRRALLRAASVAFLLGGLLLVARWARHPGGAPQLAQQAAPAAGPVGPAKPRTPVIEDLRNAGATVYQFASSAPKEPHVVFVVDRNADI